MSILYYPENIRRFVGELTIGKPDFQAGGLDAALFTSVDPPFPAESVFPDFPEYSHDAGKGVEMFSAVNVSAAGNM